MLATRLGADPAEAGGAGTSGGSGEGEPASRPPSIDIAALARKRRTKVTLADNVSVHQY